MTTKFKVFTSGVACTEVRGAAVASLSDKSQSSHHHIISFSENARQMRTHHFFETNRFPAATLLVCLGPIYSQQPLASYRSYVHGNVPGSVQLWISCYLYSFCQPFPRSSTRNQSCHGFLALRLMCWITILVTDMCFITKVNHGEMFSFSVF